MQCHHREPGFSPEPALVHPNVVPGYRSARHFHDDSGVMAGCYEQEFSESATLWHHWATQLAFIRGTAPDYR